MSYSETEIDRRGFLIHLGREEINGLIMEDLQGGEGTILKQPQQKNSSYYKCKIPRCN